MDKFQELLTEAAQLKEAQLKNERKTYESLPEYLKSGLNYSRKYRLLRRQDFLIQLMVSESLKREGNELFKVEHFAEALPKYEEALGVFRFINSRSYDNMKDEDLEYVTFQLPQEQQEYYEDYCMHMLAVYLNICSCLTKLNRKEEAVHSADQGLKLRETAKGYYKKAQAYLQFINKETADIKLGFYYLNKSYELSKDPSVVVQMHKIKKEIDEDRHKEKQWFKFMFDKNSQAADPKDPKQPNQESISTASKEVTPMALKGKETAKQAQLKSLEREKGEELEREDMRLEKTKEKLSRFTDPLLSDWLSLYEGEFIARHGSKIYSIIQLYGYREYLGEYKALLAQCLELRKEPTERTKEMYTRFFQWLRDHPIDKIAKYTERYQLQTRWIEQQRQKNTTNDGREEVKQEHREHKEREIELPISKPIKATEQEIQRDNRKYRDREETEAQIQEVPSQIRTAVEDISLMQQAPANSSLPPATENQEVTKEKEVRQESRVKLYSFAIALVLILLLRLFL